MYKRTKHNWMGAGRKLFDGKDPKEVMAKLEEAARIDASQEEMCFYADISVRALDRFLEKRPNFAERLAKLRERLPLKARQNISVQVEAGDIPLSKWTLEHKKPHEFGEKLSLQHSGTIATEDDELVKEFEQKVQERIKKRWQEKDANKK